MKFALIAAAVLAAVLDHKLVDALASFGLFHSEHLDYRHAAVVPALVAALTVLAALATAFRLDRRGGHADGSDWFVDLARAMRELPLRRTFVTVLVMQFVALFAMESVEQLLSRGALLDATAWLGTSVPLALAIGAFVAGGVTAAVRGICDAVVRATRAVEFVLRAFAIAARALGAPALVAVPARSRRKIGAPVSPLAYRSGLRAPPTR